MNVTKFFFPALFFTLFSYFCSFYGGMVVGVFELGSGSGFLGLGVFS